MARLSDEIESFIKNLIQQADGTVEIQRNEMAVYFKCVPSQINYVISTRFTNGRGYYVESHRGGGGHICIKKVNFGHTGTYLMHIITSMGDNISNQCVEIFVNNFLDYGIVSPSESMLIKAAVSDQALCDIPPKTRDCVRASILKNVLISLIV